MAGTDAPDMQVGDAIIAAFETRADRRRKFRIGRGVEQHGAGIADQAPRPVGDHQRAHQADRGIEPGPAIGPGRQQACDRQHRRQRVGHDVEERSAQIVVVVVVMIAVIMVMVVTMSGRRAPRRSAD